MLGLSACCLPAAAVLASGGGIASVVLAQDEETSLAVGRFCGVLIIGLWPAALTLAVQKFLQVRNDVVPVALTSFAAFVANVGLNWLYIRRAGLGLVGSALATSTSRVLNLVLVAAYVRFDRKSWRAIVRPSVSGTHADDGDEWDAIEVEARGGAAGGASRSLRAGASDRTSLLAASTDRDAIRKMCHLGSRGAAMVAAEASSFDVTVVFASQLSQVALDAHMAMLNVCSLTFMTGPMAFGIAANVRVGNLLGAADPARAALAARVSVGIGIAWMAACALGIVAFRSRVGELFVGKDDAEVIDLVRKIAPIAAVFQIFDGALGTCNGVLRACGKQSLLARVNIGPLWGIGVLLGFILTFPVEMGVLGLWIGLAAGVCAGGFVLAAVAAGLFAYVVALHATTIYDLVETASTFGTAGILVTTIGALFVRRGGQRVAVIAIIVGLVTTPFAEYVLRWPAPFLTSVAASSLTFAVGVLLSTRTVGPSTTSR